MLANLLISAEYLLWFLFVLTIVVFIHEFGHYIVARLNGVHVEVFSIGFGRKILEFKDRYGTRWQIASIPFGGYVKMLGDSDPSSTPNAAQLESMSDKDKSRSLHHQALWRKGLIVFAGPAFNYLSAVIIVMGLLYTYGKVVSEPVVSAVIAGSAAEEVGIAVGDRVLEVDGSAIVGFDELRKSIVLNVGQPIELLIERNNNILKLQVLPKLHKTKDIYGNDVELPTLGIASDSVTMQKLSLSEAAISALQESYSISQSMLRTLWQMVVGERSIKQLGGPIKIAQYSGQSARYGISSVLWFIALISLNLALVNLLPIPMLDGGHLMYYAVEALTGRPVAERFQVVASKVSLALLLALMLLVTYNDIMGLYS